MNFQLDYGTSISKHAKLLVFKPIEYEFDRSGKHHQIDLPEHIVEPDHKQSQYQIVYKVKFNEPGSYFI